VIVENLVDAVIKRVLADFLGEEHPGGALGGQRRRVGHLVDEEGDGQDGNTVVGRFLGAEAAAVRDE